MPPFTWIREPTGVIQSFETHHKNQLAGVLFAWAASAVESLHYLDDIDRAYDNSHTVINAHALAAFAVGVPRLERPSFLRSLVHFTVSKPFPPVPSFAPLMEHSLFARASLEGQ